MTTVQLTGCRPEPIGSYLKALGLLRIVGEQMDSSATGWWDGDAFTLSSSVDGEELIQHLCDRYRPTPVLSPWNSDSGFKHGTSTATKTLLAIEASDDPRFAPYQEAIAVVRALRGPTWDQMSTADQVGLLRNNMADQAITWLDAAVVLRPERAAFPRLLGTGGNLRRLELSPNFMARLLLLLDARPKPRSASEAWLRSSLFDVGSPALRHDKVGQFDPGAAGGARADSFGVGDPLTNPWDFVLLIEGSLVWASGVSRRLGSSTASATVPFSVGPSAVGHGSLAHSERATAELWAPLWDAPLDLARVQRLFAEGRISWSGRQARTGLDAVRAVKSLGIDVGIRQFVRHVVSERMGQSPLAVPVGRVDVADRTAETNVLASLDGWTDRLRRAASANTAPQALVDAAHRVDRAMFAATSGRASDLQQLLVEVARAEGACGRTERGRADGPVPPVPWLPAKQWLPLLDDGTPELRLAAALGTAHDRDGATVNLIRTLVRPIDSVPAGADRFGLPRWRRCEALVPGFGTRPVTEVLADCLVARSERDVERDRSAGPELGARPWFSRGIAPAPGDTERLAADELDEQRLASLIGALLVLRDDEPGAHSWRGEATEPVQAQPAWRVLAPFYARTVPRSEAASRLLPETSWARRLRGGDVAHVVADALLRWRLQGTTAVHQHRSAPVLAQGADGPRLAAALLCNAHPEDIDRARRAVALESAIPEGDNT